MNGGRAFGAISIINATATGRGCALAVEGGVAATWMWQEGGLVISGAPDARLAQACLELARLELGIEDGASIETASTYPAARGLKTSSSAAAAMLRAAGVPEQQVVATAIAASRSAGVTLTGAFDDQVAVVKGGCKFTDNRRQEVLAELLIEPWHVAIWVPDRSIKKAAVANIDTAPIKPQIEAAENRLLADDIAEAMNLNGAAFTQLYQAAGLPVSAAPADAARQAGAVAAGLSGTGPAVAALFDEPNEIVPVPGGTWQWTRAQGAI